MIEWASSTTCALVTMLPEPSQKKPDPVPMLNVEEALLVMTVISTTAGDTRSKRLIVARSIGRLPAYAWS